MSAKIFVKLNFDAFIFSILGASALPSVKKAAGGLEPPPTILATGQNNNRKKLQLQFSFQEKSVSDDEDNDDEIGSFAFVSQNRMKHTSYNSFYKWTKTSSLEITIFYLKMMVKSGLDFLF